MNSCCIFANENLLSTDEGTRLVEIRAYKELYAELLIEEKPEEEGNEASEETENEDEEE